MKILYVTQWFEPEPAFKGIHFARALADAGHNVRVVTGFPNYPTGKLYPGYRLRPLTREVLDGIAVDRLALWPSHDRSGIARSLNYLSFFLSLFVYALFRRQRYDVIYVYHPPITPALVIACAGCLRPTPFVLDVQDLWPDSVGASGMASPRAIAVLDRLCRFVYARATQIIGQSNGIVDRLASQGLPRAKLSRIYNWSTYRAESSPDATLPAALERAFAGRTNFVYGGNLGQAQSLASLVEACMAARARAPDIRLHLFGHGIERGRLIALAAQSHGCVIVHDPLPRDATDRVFDRADILAMHLKDDPLFDITIPSKLQHYLAVGKPILAGVSGEATAILRDSGAAMVCRPMDVTALADAVTSLARMDSAGRASMGRAGRSYYADALSFPAALARTDQIVGNAAKGTGGVF